MAWSSSLSQAPPKSRPLSAAGGRGSNGSGQPAVSPVFSLGSGGGGAAGSNTAADHLALADAAIAAVPPGFRRKLMVTCDGAGASHALIKRLDELAGRRGYELTYSVGWALGEREKAALRLVPGPAWQVAVDRRGEVRGGGGGRERPAVGVVREGAGQTGTGGGGGPGGRGAVAAGATAAGPPGGC